MSKSVPVEGAESVEQPSRETSLPLVLKKVVVGQWLLSCRTCEAGGSGIARLSGPQEVLSQNNDSSKVKEAGEKKKIKAQSKTKPTSPILMGQAFRLWEDLYIRVV